MDKLFSDSGTFQKERPTKLSKDKERELYLKLANEIIENGWSEYDAEQIADDLSLLPRHEHNGYKLAKRLESTRLSTMYNIDAQFVDWLDCFAYELNDAVRGLVQEWIKAHDIKPKLTVGMKFNVDNNCAFWFHPKKTDVAYITGVDERSARYTVWHEKEHEGGILIEYERLEKIIEDQNKQHGRG